MAIHIKIPRRLGQLDPRPLHPLLHLHLTPQPTRMRQPKSHIQHILLVLPQTTLLALLLQQPIVHFLRQNDVAGGTGADPLAGSFHFDSGAMGGLEEGFAEAGRDGCGGGVGVEEG